jgi:hypothetical protein
MPGLVMPWPLPRRQEAHLGEAEVDDLHEVAAGPRRLEDDVLGLEIAVDDAEVVRLAERREHLASSRR